MLLAALWPDPADPLCPERFLKEAAERMRGWRDTRGGTPRDLNDPKEVRQALLDFIADFANWDNSNDKDFLETSRALVQCAHESLGGAPGTRPLVVDPFAGGGAIPLEALRVGADAFASDLNPVAVLLNKVVLEYIPRYGQRLADDVRKWGEWVKKEAEKDLAEFYPKDPDGAVPVAYLWARTVKCEGPGCGAEVPLIRSLWLAKRKTRPTAMRLVPNKKHKRVDVEIIEEVKEKDVGDGTVKRGSASCPVCGFTTKVDRVRAQLRERHGGAADARLLCVANIHPNREGRGYRLPMKHDLVAVDAAVKELERRKRKHKGEISLLPDETLDVRGIRHTWAMIYGLERWADYFTPRQALVMVVLGAAIQKAAERMTDVDAGLLSATKTVLGLALSRYTDICNANCRWENTKTQVRNLFSRQAIGMVWDFAEPHVLGDAAGDFAVTLETMVRCLERESSSATTAGQARQASATAIPLPDDSADAFITDPPYYDAVPYAYLSDFFYVWLRRALGDGPEGLFSAAVVPKDEEIVVDRPHELSTSTKDVAFYERELINAFIKGRRVLRPGGIGTIVFASKTTKSWEAILNAVVEAGFVITGSWPIDTEMDTRVAAQGQARLASSIHLVCRPRENPDGSLRTDEIGDWRDVLAALPKRIHEWMPRLRDEGIVGADAIFACLGPALEIFSRYSRVEKASGEVVTLKGYLEHVWTAVSKEALAAIFSGADTAAFEEDARLTAMWLWTLNGGVAEDAEGGGEDADADDDDGESGGNKPKGGFELEYDAARKIAQGLGAHLADLATLVEVKGSTARLLPVAERPKALFGQPETPAVAAATKKKRKQLTLGFIAEDESESKAVSGMDGKLQAKPGATVLDRVHQAMILFGAGRSEALRRFLVDDGAGDDRFWRLGQALAALYPTCTEDRRWIEGVMARKKGLGL
jgi:adenine-specific DNA methylase